MSPTSTDAQFDQRYQTHLKHIKLKGLQPKTIDAYSRAIRQLGNRATETAWSLLLGCDAHRATAHFAVCP